jgi:hypothetical protein
MKIEQQTWRTKHERKRGLGTAPVTLQPVRIPGWHSQECNNPSCLLQTTTQKGFNELITSTNYAYIQHDKHEDLDGSRKKIPILFWEENYLLGAYGYVMLVKCVAIPETNAL